MSLDISKSNKNQRAVPGSIVELSFNGTKQKHKYRILKYNDIISGDCWQQINDSRYLNATLYTSEKDYNENTKLDFYKFLNKTLCVGDTVSQHSNRIYIAKCES